MNRDFRKTGRVGLPGRPSLPETLILLMVLSFVSSPLVAQSRHPAVAGSFYPGDPEVLSKLADGFLASATPKKLLASSARLVGLISPHAGYVFSGQTAAVAFKSLAGQSFDRVYFLGVDHHSGLPTVSIWLDGAFDTPMGPVPVDASPSEALVKKGGIFSSSPELHLREHSLEVQLPFFIKTVGFRPAVFVSVGGRPENGFELGKELLKEILGFSGRVLIVASSDWSHYHDARTAKILDEKAIQSVLALDPQELLEDCALGKAELCGLNGVLALLTVMKEAGALPTLLERTDSSRTTGDASQVVGYAAILFEAESIPIPASQAARLPAIEAQMPVSTGSSLLQEEPSLKYRKEALTAVRKTLETVLAGGKIPQPDFQDARFKEKRGVFVTLKKNGELRGCIGLIEGRKPLTEAIPEMAVAAATEDPRFTPVSLKELKELHVEISILSPLIPVKDFAEIQVGRDGVLLRESFNSGVFLPQVAPEQGWDRETLLENLCYKAGLPSGSHKKPDARLFRFTADVFAEKE